MPKPVYYRANSIIYFQGDKADGVYILKDGRAELTFEDLQTGAEVREPLKAGEFFGVKAALGHFLHDETAMAVSDCTVVHFTVPEFENVVSGNHRIMMKMLQVFSTQLRRIHHQVQGLLSEDQGSTNPEAGLFAVGEYYLQDRQFSHASRVFKRYLELWPTGAYAPQATLKKGEADTGKPAEKARPAPALRSFTEIENAYKNGQYQDAMKGYLMMIRDKLEPENLAHAEFRAGYCLYYLEKYDEAMRHLAAVIRKYPKYPQLGEAVYYMGVIHESKGDKIKALSFLNKAGQMVPESGPMYREILGKIRALGGAA